MKVMISCGEASGDLYAAALTRDLIRLEPSVEVFGFGGPRLAAAGGRLLGDFGGLAVTGLTEALRVVPRALMTVRRLTAHAKHARPDVFVAIDAPDFNFSLMAAIQRLGIPIVYYVSPQLWAWRPGRMRTMQALVDRVLVIFPFEEALYRDAGVPVTFVGHPLVDLAVPAQAPAALRGAHGLVEGAPTVALLPGSRRNEVRRLAPIVIDALARIRASVPDAQFLVARAPDLPDGLFEPFAAWAARHPGAHLAIVDGRTDDVLAACDVAITASGTATVQCALHERPMVVVYRLSRLSYALGKPFVKVNTYAMANLVAGERIVPELIQDACTAERIADEIVALLTDRAHHARTREALRRVRERLGAAGASGRAAEAVLDVARGTSTRKDSR